MNVQSSNKRPHPVSTVALTSNLSHLAIGMGDGGETQAPMGRAVIGGVITSTLLTLVVVPVAYTYLDNLGKRATRWFKGNGKEHDSAHDDALAELA